MKKQIVKIGIILTGILIPVKTLACTCPIKKLSELQQSEIESADCIFIGEIIESNEEDYSFTIRVIESLDGGDDNNNIYIAKSFTSCDIFTDTQEQWIIYGRTEGNYLTLFECGLSRPVNRPYAGIRRVTPIRESDKKENHQNNFEQSLEQAKTNLNSEIESLRKLRDGLASN